MEIHAPTSLLKRTTFVALVALAASVTTPAQAFGLGGLLHPKMISPGAKALQPGQSRLFDFGKNTKPRYAYESARPDGSRSLVYGNQRKPGGTIRPIEKPHGHSVRDTNGDITYSRTPGGTTLKDVGAHY